MEGCRGSSSDVSIIYVPIKEIDALCVEGMPLVFFTLDPGGRGCLITSFRPLAEKLVARVAMVKYTTWQVRKCRMLIAVAVVTMP